MENVRPLNNFNFMIPMLYHNVLPKAEEYVESIEAGKFEDVQTENGIFKGIQERGEDALYSLVSAFMPEYEIVMNFVRKSTVRTRRTKVYSY